MTESYLLYIYMYSFLLFSYVSFLIYLVFCQCTLKFSDGVQCSSEHDGVNKVHIFSYRFSVPSECSALYPVNANVCQVSVQHIQLYVDLVLKPSGPSCSKRC